jgi:integrase
MYYDAMEHGEVLHNPAAGALRGIENRRARPPYEPFSLEEARRFLIAAKTYEPHWYPILLCALTTGMRQGELLALRPHDIDFVTGFITVRSSFHRGVYNPPKNHKIRRIDMNERLADVLSRFLTWKIALALELEHERPRNERRTKEKVLAEVREKQLFATLYGGRLHDHKVYKAFRRTLKKAGLRRIRFHDLRHTFATLLLQQGESPAYVRDQLGHHSIQMTMDFYGHLVARSNKVAANDLVNSIDDTSIRPAKRRDRRTNVTTVMRKSDYLRRSWI